MNTIRKFKFPIKLFCTSLLLATYSFSFSQNNAPTYALDFVNGISAPIGDFKNYADGGFNSSFIISRKFCNDASIDLSTNYTSLPIPNEFGVTNHRWNTTTINVGPRYTISGKKFSVGFYGKLGLSFITIPEIKEYYPTTTIVVSNQESTKTSSLNTRLGINLGIEVCNGLQFYIGSEYVTNLGSQINYSSRDLSSAISAKGTIDPDLASEIPFTEENFSFSTLNVNFGIRIDIGGNSSNSRATDYNSSRSNRTTSAVSVGDENEGDGNSGGTRATDYNSSRSNRTTSAISVGDENEGDGNSGGTRATDYNSSRSNRTTSAVSVGDENEGNGNNGGTRATDYNSSRSNRSTSAISVGDENEGDGNSGGTRATDYNSSRSNRTTSAVSVGDENEGNGNNGGTRATDYNSSRSNRTTSAISVGDENEGDDTNDNTRKSEAEKTVLSGDLVGISLSKRTFKFKDDKGKVITGIVPSKISDSQLNEYSKRYLNKTCKIRVSTQGTGSEIQYALEEIVE